jgi:hypothetical protein
MGTVSGTMVAESLLHVQIRNKPNKHEAESGFQNARGKTIESSSRHPYDPTYGCIKMQPVCLGSTRSYVSGLRTILRKQWAESLTADSSPALPAQPETPNDGHLAGLLTYASLNLKRLPGSSQWQCCSSSQRIQLRGSGGFSPRFPIPDGKSYR